MVDPVGRLSGRLEIYKITIKGYLNEKWIDWLNGDVAEINHPTGSSLTIIKVHVPDQAALRGILNKLWDLNLILISAILLDHMEGEYNET